MGSIQGLLRGPLEDAPVIRRADAGKAAQLCAARSVGCRRADYGGSLP